MEAQTRPHRAFGVDMKDPETTTVFAGLDGRTDTELPEWYAEQHATPDPVSFSQAIRELPQAIETAVAYRNPYTEEWVETERFNALVEPSRLQAEANGGTEAESLFHIPTDSYAIIHPVDVYRLRISGLDLREVVEGIIPLSLRMAEFEEDNTPNRKRK